MSLYALIKPKGPSGFGYGSTAEDTTAGLLLQGKTILVTGCNSGLGYETMRVLALRGATVIGAARNEASAASACRAVGGQATGTACDLTIDMLCPKALQNLDLLFAADDVHQWNPIRLAESV
jgi:WW domain-containing oxidoreductase